METPTLTPIRIAVLNELLYYLLLVWLLPRDTRHLGLK